MYKKIAKWTVVFCGIVFLCLLTLAIARGNSYQPQKADALVILGHSLNPKDGYKPSEWLVFRLEKGLELYHQGYAGKIIVTGGKVGPYPLSVAEAMKIWLLDHGVPGEDIIVEDKAANTRENFLYSKILADEYGLVSIITVTNDFHMFRSMFIGKKYFGSISGCAAPSRFSPALAAAYLKEPLSMLKFTVTYLLCG